MKKIIFFSTLLLLISGCSRPIKNSDAKGDIIVCFGNSITAGVGISEKDAYPEVLEKLVGKKVIGAGHGGDTTQSALGRLKRDVLDRKPFLVIVELGGNDYLRQIPRQITMKNLETIILKIQEQGSAVALCDISSGFLLSGYRRDFKKLARKTGAIFIPSLLQGILNDPSLKIDRLHPNKKGHALIAQRIHREIRKYFRFKN